MDANMIRPIIQAIEDNLPILTRDGSFFSKKYEAYKARDYSTLDHYDDEWLRQDDYDSDAWLDIGLPALNETITCIWNEVSPDTVLSLPVIGMPDSEQKQNARQWLDDVLAYIEDRFDEINIACSVGDEVPNAGRNILLLRLCYLDKLLISMAKSTSEEWFGSRIAPQPYAYLKENKDHLIKRTQLTPEQQATVIDFFKTHPNLENKINWNNLKTLTYADFEQLMNDNAGSRANRKAAAAAGDKAALFRNKKGFEVYYENENFVFVMPFTYTACKFCDSVNIEEQGAKWCIGYEKDEQYYIDHVITNKESFVMVLKKKPEIDFDEITGYRTKPTDNRVMLELNPDYLNVWNQADNQQTDEIDLTYGSKHCMYLQKFLGVPDGFFEKAYAHYREVIDKNRKAMGGENFNILSYTEESDFHFTKDDIMEIAASNGCFVFSPSDYDPTVPESISVGGWYLQLNDFCDELFDGDVPDDFDDKFDELTDYAESDEGELVCLTFVRQSIDGESSYFMYTDGHNCSICFDRINVVKLINYMIVNLYAHRMDDLSRLWHYDDYGIFDKFNFNHNVKYNNPQLLKGDKYFKDYEDIELFFNETIGKCFSTLDASEEDQLKATKRFVVNMKDWLIDNNDWFQGCRFSSWQSTCKKICGEFSANMEDVLSVLI